MTTNRNIEKNNNEESVLTYEVFDETLETAVGNIIAGGLHPCSLHRLIGLSGLSCEERRHSCQTAS
jgi:hypothetical protein